MSADTLDERQIDKTGHQPPQLTRLPSDSGCRRNNSGEAHNIAHRHTLEPSTDRHARAWLLCKLGSDEVRDWLLECGWWQQWSWCGPSRVVDWTVTIPASVPPSAGQSVQQLQLLQSLEGVAGIGVKSGRFTRGGVTAGERAGVYWRAGGCAEN